MPKKLLLLLCLTLLLPLTPVSAQKALRSVRDLLKAGKASEALTQIAKLEKDSTISQEPRLYHYGVEANIALNNAQNEKAFLKQNYDTAQFFSSTYGICHYVLKADSAEQQQLNTKGKTSKKIRSSAKSAKEYLHKYYKNLNAGGRYYYRKKNYAEAGKYLRLALDIPTLKLWGEDTTVTEKPHYVETATLLLRAAFQQKDFPLLLKYKDIALRDTSASRPIVLETLARTYEAQGDTTNYLSTIHEGLHEYPKTPYFFTEMADYYAEHGDYTATLQLADSLLLTDTTNLYFLSAKSLALMNLGRDTESIATSKRILAIDSTLAEVYYYTGAAYCNLADDVQLPTTINSRAYKQADAKRTGYYKAACPYLEKYRQLVPAAKEKWAPLLYNVYLAMNQGDKFEEIQHIMSETFPAKP